MLRILLLGKNGQVGWELQRALAPLGTLIALDYNSEEYCADFRDPEGVAETVRILQPDIIVNAVAYNAVDKAESEPDLTRLLNNTTVSAIAKEASILGAWLIHYSTDYVFDGSGDHPWSETIAPAPLNVYGETKLEGELAIQELCSKYLIFRTSWIYAPRGHNFAKTILQLAKDKTELSIINDQFGAPTGAELLADCTAHAISTAISRPELAGIYHLTASGVTTWFNYANFIFDVACELDTPLAIKEVKAVLTSAFPTPAVRPHNSRLDCTKFCDSFGMTLPDWKVGVRRVLLELLDLK